MDKVFVNKREDDGCEKEEKIKITQNGRTKYKRAATGSSRRSADHANAISSANYGAHNNSVVSL